MAFPIAVIGTTQMLSIRIAAEKPASIFGPKLFTTDCTSIMPMETVDCCKIEGSAIRDMSFSSSQLKTFGFGFFPSFVRFPVDSPASSGASSPVLSSVYLDKVRRNRKRETTAEIPCAIRVAQATPATPI